MSRAVPPWLGHLRTDRRGLPVPYINRWGGEDLARVRVDHDPHVGGPGVFADDDPDGEPDFLHQHMARQRECMLSGLCQVCGRGVPWSRRFLVVADMSVDRITVPGRGERVTVTEPWLDERCATFATLICPALIRRTRQENLRLVPVTSRRDAELVCSYGWVEGDLEQATRATPPAMWAKALLTRLHVEVQPPRVQAVGEVGAVVTEEKGPS